jgi:hypothetical protein
VDLAEFLRVRIIILRNAEAISDFHCTVPGEFQTPFGLLVLPESTKRTFHFQHFDEYSHVSRSHQGTNIVNRQWRRAVIRPGETERSAKEAFAD